MKFLISIFIISNTLFGFSALPTNYAMAREYSNGLLLQALKDYNLTTVYSNIPITYKVNTKSFTLKFESQIILIPAVDLYTSKKYESRSGIIEWEHVVPASVLVNVYDDAKKAWNKGHPSCVTSSGKVYKGRVCAEKVSPRFNVILADLYNLQPALGSLNALRSDKPYCEVQGEKREFGETIDFEISNACAEPRDAIKGDLARIMLYMNKKYGVQFNNHDNTMKMLKAWDIMDPIDVWETKKREILSKTYNMTF